MSLNPELLRDSRMQQGLTQNDVAKSLNVTRQTVSKWETGRGYPETDNLVQLAHLYHLDLEDLFKNEQIGQQRELTNTEPLNNTIAKDNSMPAFLILGLSLLIPVFGVPLPIYVWRKNKKSNTYFSLIRVLCVVSFLIVLFSAYNVVDGFFPYGDETVQTVK